ncbi:MAG: hypothetical protein ACLTDR_06250 [Adlercreutzia equolifaciens]
MVFLAPRARPFDDAYADKLAAADRSLFICGHYEEHRRARLRPGRPRHLAGDYVLTSGELASMVVIDAAVRQAARRSGGGRRPRGRDPSPAAFWNIPQYTRPADFRGMRVPEVLTSGNHAAIARAGGASSPSRATAAARPDLIVAAEAAGRLTPLTRNF